MIPKFSLKTIFFILTACACTIALVDQYRRYLVSGGVRQVPFRSEEWKQVDPWRNKLSSRRNMIVDLIQNRDLLGMHREHVIKLLGRPDNAVSEGFLNWDSCYLIGLERAGWSSLDDEFLLINYDERGCVISYRLATN